MEFHCHVILVTNNKDFYERCVAMFNPFETKSYNIDLFFEKIEQKNYEGINQTEFEEIVMAINNIYNGGDDLIEQFSKAELIQQLDCLSRAMTHCHLDKRNKYYIFSNLYKLKEGISSESRRRLFSEKSMVIEDELSIKNIYVTFRFGILNEQPYLLMKHSYGNNSIMNLTEQVIAIIESEYLKRYGFDLIEHVEHIYFTDVSFGVGRVSCEKVLIEKGFKNPKWESFDKEQFDKLWKQLNPDMGLQPIFLEPNNSFKAYSLIKEILLQAKKKIQIIDPYFDKTIYHLIGELNADIQVQLITERVLGDAGIVYSKIKKERGKIEVKASKNNHDRFIIIDEKMVFLLGGSINSIGDKASMIIPIDLNTVKQEIKNHFKAQWSAAKEINEG